MKRFVEDSFTMQSSLPSLDNRVAWIVSKAGHQCDGDMIEDLLKPQHQLIPRIVGQFDVGDDHIVLFVGTADHRNGLVAALGRLDDATIAFEQRMGIIAYTLVGVDDQDPATDEFRVVLVEFPIGGWVERDERLADALDRLFDAAGFAQNTP